MLINKFRDQINEILKNCPCCIAFGGKRTICQCKKQGTDGNFSLLSNEAATSATTPEAFSSALQALQAASAYKVTYTFAAPTTAAATSVGR